MQKLLVFSSFAGSCEGWDWLISLLKLSFLLLTLLCLASVWLNQGELAVVQTLIFTAPPNAKNPCWGHYDVMSQNRFSFSQCPCCLFFVPWLCWIWCLGQHIERWSALKHDNNGCIRNTRCLKRNLQVSANRFVNQSWNAIHALENVDC